MSSCWDFSKPISNWKEKLNLVTLPQESVLSSPKSEITEHKEETNEAVKAALEKIENEISSLPSFDRFLVIPPRQSPFELPAPYLEASKSYQSKPTTPASARNKPQIVRPSIFQEKTQQKAIVPAPRAPSKPSQPPQPPKEVFKAIPNFLSVVNFKVGSVYKMNFQLQNISPKTNGFQFKMPVDPGFVVAVLDSVDTSKIRPGLHLNLQVTFTPTEARTYEDKIQILPGPDSLPTIVNLKCYWDPPDLILPDIVDLGATLVYNQKCGSFSIKNKGGVASFEIFSNLGVKRENLYQDGPFTIVPPSFTLDRDEEIELTISYRPSEQGFSSVSFEIIPNYFKDKFFFVATGEGAVPKLKFSLTSEQNLFLPFLPSESSTTRDIEIVNDSNVSYPFYVQILRQKESIPSKLAVLYPGTETTRIKKSSPFSVSPASGSIGANDKLSLRISFQPKAYAFFWANIVVFASKIPNEVGDLLSLKMLTISVEASSGPPSLLINPPMALFNYVVPGTENKSNVEITNNSFLPISIRWILDEENNEVVPSEDSLEIPPHGTVPVQLTCVLNRIQRNICPKMFHSFSPLPTVTSRQYELTFSSLFVQNPVEDEVQETLEVPSEVQEETRNELETSCKAQVEQVNKRLFKYSVNVQPPSIQISPPILYFGDVLVSTVASQNLTLKNQFAYPIFYEILVPQNGLYTCDSESGVIEGESSTTVKIDVCSSIQNGIQDMISVTSYWIKENEKDFPFVFYIPLSASFDRPLIQILNRVIDIGTVYPTITYFPTLQMKLLNQFPCDAVLIPRSFPILIQNEEIIQYLKFEREVINLVPEVEASVKVSVLFASIGNQAFPMTIKVLGDTLTAAIIADVVPPLVDLKTTSIDFSSDFVICKTSQSSIVVSNECEVSSNVQLLLIESPSNVFKLDDEQEHVLPGHESLSFNVSCYSEIHGDYYGTIRLRIFDLWQSKEIDIPLHVKALGSFFGFCHHTLGYTLSTPRDYVSFGTSKLNGRKVLRRLTLENYSSAAISIEWTIENFVKGRQYIKLNLEVTDEAKVLISFTPTGLDALQSPFSLHTDSNVIESHGKVVAEITFDPIELGTFGGCISARSGEFVHKINLRAFVVR